MTTTTPTVTLPRIDTTNWRDYADLRIRPDQEGLVCSNDRSLAEAGVRDDARAYGIAFGDRPVGLVVTLDWPERLEIHRLMVAADHQGQGYASSALRHLIVEERESGRTVGIKFLAWNVHARRVYSAVGFTDTGRVEGDERVFEYVHRPAA